MTVGFLSKDWTLNVKGTKKLPAGCGFYRCYLPMKYSGVPGRMGWPVFNGQHGFGVDNMEGQEFYGFDKVMLKLVMDKWTPEQIRRAQALGQFVMADLDDYHDGLHLDNRAYADTDPELHPTSNRDHYKAVIAAVDLVTVATPFLAEWALTMNPNVRMIRNGVDLTRFTRKRKFAPKPTIGWVGQIPYRSGDLEPMREWLPEFLERHDLAFHHAGHRSDAPSFCDLTGVNPERVTTSPGVPMSIYRSMFDRIDIGLVPLSPIDFNEAKSGLKGMEYAASGIPFVASSTAEYRHLAGTGVGRVASTPEQWWSQLTTLLPAKARVKVEKNNYAALEQHRIEHRGKEWADVLR